MESNVLVLKCTFAAANTDLHLQTCILQLYNLAAAVFELWHRPSVLADWTDCSVSVHVTSLHSNPAACVFSPEIIPRS